MKRALALAGLALVVSPAVAVAQHAPGELSPPGGQGSRNVRVLSHIPLGRVFTVGDIEIEQELTRPYAYVPRLHRATNSGGFNIISLKDPTKAKSIYYWQIEQADLHQGIGALQNKYFKTRGRYYDAQSVQFASSGPDGHLRARAKASPALRTSTRSTFRRSMEAAGITRRSGRSSGEAGVVRGSPERLLDARLYTPGPACPPLIQCGDSPRLAGRDRAWDMGGQPCR